MKGIYYKLFPGSGNVILSVAPQIPIKDQKV